MKSNIKSPSVKVNLENPARFNEIVAEVVILESENGIQDNSKFVLKGLNLSVPVEVLMVRHTIKLNVNRFLYNYNDNNDFTKINLF